MWSIVPSNNSSGGCVASVDLRDLVSKIANDNALIIQKLMDVLGQDVAARVAMADYVGRTFRWSGSDSSSSSMTTPFILTRSNVECSFTTLTLHIPSYYQDGTGSDENDDAPNNNNNNTAVLDLALKNYKPNTDDLLRHVACQLVQNYLRSKLTDDDNDWIAFCANGSILPRASGMSQAPLHPDKVVPLVSPVEFQQTIDVSQVPFIEYYLPPKAQNSSSFSVTGMAISAGITLICGGGYHGKSTLLQCIASGVYNKVPGDGRELCVTRHNALTVRSEDGRHVSNINISNFISNLPTLPGGGSHCTKSFSSSNASGSTSQATNVVEAIEMGTSCLLIDEDVSAANFMARDGRMRALVMDESITPLLYRVNGLFNALKISSIVVVGGVGDWLDVPHRVILLNQYQASDATAKARSISRQFSHGHVQYGGRGVVHRLEWDETPIPRRPIVVAAANNENSNATTTTTSAATTSSSSKSDGAIIMYDKWTVSLVEGSQLLRVRYNRDHCEADSNNKEEDFGFIDMSKCEQLLGRKPQLFGCGVCVLWILHHSVKNPDLGTNQLLDLLYEKVQSEGFWSLLQDALHHESKSNIPTITLPRRYEVFMALTRLRGMVTFEELPIEQDSDAALKAAAEEARKQQELNDLWNSRRKKNRFDSN